MNYALNLVFPAYKYLDTTIVKMYYTNLNFNIKRLQLIYSVIKDHLYYL